VKALKLIILCLFLLTASGLYAQSDTILSDTIQPKKWEFKTTRELADTAWWALKQKTNDDFMSLIPTLAVIKETFDSLEIKNNPQVIRLKYNYISHHVSKQLKFLQKKAKVKKVKFKTSELDDVMIKEGKDDKGNAFAYVTLKSHKSSKEFTVKFVAMQLNKNWYIMDELKLEFPEDDPYYKPPVKIKKKQK